MKSLKTSNETMGTEGKARFALKRRRNEETSYKAFMNLKERSGGCLETNRRNGLVINRNAV